MLLSMLMGVLGFAACCGCGPEGCPIGCC